MGAFFLNHVFATPKELTRSTSEHVRCCISGLSSWKKRMNVVRCQSSGNFSSSKGLSSVQSDIKTQDQIPLKHAYDTTLMDSGDGIGIVRFLNGKNILVTGATGFLGKVLIEKILRAQADVGKIYLLIMAKNKEAAKNRLKTEILSTELFKCLQQAHGKSYEAAMLSKLVPVVGNVRESNLGIEADLAEEIAEEVDVILNLAANTTFDERYDVAIDTNTQGPSRLMGFGKRCRKLKLFLHVSTAYVNGERRGRILEKPFFIGDSIAKERLLLETTLSTSLPVLDVGAETKLACTEAASQVNTVNEKMKELGIERARLYGWQNTYSFTKAMGEMMINSTRGEIPVVIIRPSIVESTFRDPFPGWIEGIRMIDPLVSYYGKGRLTSFLVDPKAVIDLVPADMVVNATIAAMAKHGAAQKPGLEIYHVASSVVNPILLGDLFRFFYEHFHSFPCMGPDGKPIPISRLKLFNTMHDFSSQLWTDTVQRSGQAAAIASNTKLSDRLKKLVAPVQYLAELYEPYTFYGGWRSFGFDVRSINWEDYITKIHIPGLRRHAMKEKGMSG
uniref:Fatty acyl-CoA reductase n=1 Tax=Nelumbo nucifera TaxID=4432 RepID=A0A822ZU11_NELNU|nr:TPA_asm: hypothetical protein HUJ06_018380 [Nelumbo nucifera]